MIAVTSRARRSGDMHGWYAAAVVSVAEAYRRELVLRKLRRGPLELGGRLRR